MNETITITKHVNNCTSNQREKRIKNNKELITIAKQKVKEFGYELTRLKIHIVFTTNSNIIVYFEPKEEKGYAVDGGDGTITFDKKTKKILFIMRGQ